jgi:hypothetical protein
VINKKLVFKTGNNNKENGQSLVELALIFTTIVFMISILVDIGRAFFTLITLNDAAQEGAVHASMNPTYYEIDNNSPWQDTIQMIITSSSEPIDFPAELANGNFRVEHPRITGWSHEDPGFPGHTSACAGFNSQNEANTVNVIVSYDFEFIMPYMDVFVLDGILTLTAQSDSTIMYPPCD